MKLKDFGEDTPKETSGKKKRPKKNTDHIVRIEELEQIMTQSGGELDDEAIVSMYIPRRKAKSLGAALLRMDRMQLFLLIMVITVAFLFVLAFMQEKMGNFTNNLKRLEL